MVAVPAAMKAQGKPRAVGLLVAKELEVIDGLMSNPKRPLLAVMGGAKVSDKINFINALLGKVDHLLIGGKMGYTFLKAQGVGRRQHADRRRGGGRRAEAAAARRHEDHAAGRCPRRQVGRPEPDAGRRRRRSRPGYEGVDIGPKTLALYADKIKQAGTVIWNGPVGWFEKPAFSKGTRGIAEAMAEQHGRHRGRRRRDGRGGRAVRTRHEDDARLDRRRGVPRLRRREEVRVAGADRR